MATQLQLRRGTTAENDVFTGAVGEVTVDTDTSTLRVHDGITTGGFMVDTLVGFQAPTSGNNYTWYRKYKSGWVEQGGITDGTVDYSSNPISLPITMADTNYLLVAMSDREGKSAYIQSKTTTGFCVKDRIMADIWYDSNFSGSWEVKGMAAQGE